MLKPGTRIVYPIQQGLVGTLQMMKWLVSLATLGVNLVSDAFVTQRPLRFFHSRSSCHEIQAVQLPTITRGTQKNNEWDHVLSEGSVQNSHSTTRRSIIQLPDSTHAATLVRSATMELDPYGLGEDDEDMEEETESSYLSSGDEEQVSEDLETTQFQTNKNYDAYLKRKSSTTIATTAASSKDTSFMQGVKNFLKGKDFGELFFMIIIPVFAGYALTKTAYIKATDQLSEKADGALDSYADEMIYHDGDLDEMKFCHDHYNKKLMWLGPKKSDAMIKRYLEVYAKKKVVSPQAISSLSYVFSLNKLSEDRTAEIIVELCKSMGVDKIASAGKLLFFGTHILSTSEARKKLKPVKDLLASSYERDDGSVSGKEIVKRSQIAMGEAAYRAAVAAAGKKQSSLTDGWEVLGLDQDTATRIFEEVKKEGFVTGKEAKYGTANQKYDEKGRRVDTSGKLENPEEADKDDDKGDKKESATGSVYECGECGFTLFIAQGRDFRFFGEDFKCPECGAAKDKFVSVDSEN